MAGAAVADGRRARPGTGPPSRAARPARRAHWPTVAAFALVVLYVTVFALAMEHTGYDMWGALIVLPALLTIGIPILARVAAANPERNVFRLLMIAMALKLLACFARYWMSFVLYGGAADATMYDQRGSELALFLDPHSPLSGDFPVDIGRKVIGTGFIIIVTGVVYAIIGPSLVGGLPGLLVVRLLGAVAVLAGLQIAFPEADSRRYAKLVFFLPSLLFWPSSIGKDTWMMFTLGLTAYGVALLLVRGAARSSFIALGSLGTTMVRPHVTVLVGAGLSVAYLLRKRPQQASARWGRCGRCSRVVVLGVR